MDQSLGIIYSGACAYDLSRCQEDPSMLNVPTHSQHFACLFGDRDRVSGQHFYTESQVLCICNCACGIVSWRIKHGEHSQEIPVFSFLLNCNAKRTKASACEFCGFLPKQSGDLSGRIDERNDRFWGPFGTSIANAITGCNCGNTFRNWIKR